MNEDTKKSLAEAKAAVIDRAARVLEARADRVAGRKWMLFPWLRCLMILNKIARLEGFASCCHCDCHK